MPSEETFRGKGVNFPGWLTMKPEIAARFSRRQVEGITPTLL
jgi:hypothetical protein